MVIIRPLLPACAQERVCTTEMREEGRIFFLPKTTPSLEKLNDTVGRVESPLQKWQQCVLSKKTVFLTLWRMRRLSLR